VAHASDHARVVDELATTQTDDVMSAVEYVRSLPYVDRTRVAVAGCSFGGIVSLFAAERGTGVQAVVDFAGGAMSWASAPELQERMKQAARAARVPVFFVQAENDFNTAPSLVLSEEMRRAGKAGARARVSGERGDARGGAWVLRGRGEPSVGRRGAGVSECGGAEPSPLSSPPAVVAPSWSASRRERQRGRRREAATSEPAAA